VLNAVEHYILGLVTALGETWGVVEVQLPYLVTDVHHHSIQTASVPEPFWEGHRHLPTASQQSLKLGA
jgi:hypothetical protein